MATIFTFLKNVFYYLDLKLYQVTLLLLFVIRLGEREAFWLPRMLNAPPRTCKNRINNSQDVKNYVILTITDKIVIVSKNISGDATRFLEEVYRVMITNHGNSEISTILCSQILLPENVFSEVNIPTIF